MKEDQLLRFKGKFRDLIPNGFEFQKMFADNYRCYHKDAIVITIWVWQRFGGYINIGDFHEHSTEVFDWVVSGRYQESERTGILWEEIYYKAYLNKKTGKIEKESKENRSIYPMIILRQKDEGEIPEEEAEELVNAYYETYREVFMKPEDIEVIKELRERGFA